jgi:GMP synthase (glutamine-hydrolysing)
MNIHYLQHVPFEDLGSIADWARERRHHVTVTRLYEDEAFPSQRHVDWLVVMGGPMNIYEEQKYPWLVGEKRFIEHMISAGKVVLGICLGAQLLADVLGARIYKNREKEIGWFPIQLTENAIYCPIFQDIPAQLDAFHWHGDTFDLPRDALHLATSEVCKHQAFSYNSRVLGFQFHLETTKRNAEQLIAHCRDELVDAPFIQTSEAMLADEVRFQRINEVMRRILEQLETLDETC